MSKYTIAPVDNYSQWNDFVDDSPQGTIFSYTSYLNEATENWKLYWVRKGNQIKAGLCLILDHAEQETILDDLVIHNGLLFAPDGDQKATKARLSRFEISEMIIAWLDENFQKIQLALSPQIEDLRPFLWHNYHSTNPVEKYQLDLRYTSYIDISSISSSEDDTSSTLFRELETIRQRNIRQARKAGATTSREGDGEVFCSYYSELMSAQDEVQDRGKMVRMKRLIDKLISENTGAMLLTRNLGGDAIYATVFGWDTRRAYYLFGAPVPNASESYKGTIAFWDAFHFLAKQGITTVDMEGINSPKRGWYKLSFGGDVRYYYQVYKNAQP